jgi:pimeloyl-ACP methyl ester carboxylesterase
MTLAHDVTGSGPAVLLLHSTVCDRRMWDPQVPALAAAGHRVIRCDLRGYGDSPIPAEPWDDASDVAGLLTSLGTPRVAVIGASGGGKVALEIAARWPDRVTALALLCTAMPGFTPGPRLRAFGEREDELLEAGDIAGATDLNVDLWLGPEADKATHDRVREMQRHAFEVQLAALASTPAQPDSPTQPEVRESTPTDTPAPSPTAPDVRESTPAQPESPAASTRTEPDLSRITAPALLLSGAHDLPDFREIAAHLAGVLPGSRHVELDWAGHLPSLERPDLINPLLLDFLA